jgi:hypothetical protein
MHTADPVTAAVPMAFGYGCSDITTTSQTFKFYTVKV